ncbi:thoc7 [Carabus blaptoides fortunei]
MTDEDVIRRRLLIDGDGTGDDRRLNVFLKNLIKWSNLPYENKDNQIIHDKMLSQLTHCEFAVKKSLISTNMITQELESYGSTCNTIKTNIEDVKTRLSVALNDLKEAKTVRKNKMEYDILAKVIKEQPDRKETDKRLKELMNELADLEERSKQLEKKLDTRRKQFFVLISSANQLRDLLENADNDEIMDTSLDIDDLPDTILGCPDESLEEPMSL